MNIGKNSLVLCELHYTFIHGKTYDSDPFIESHYLLIGKLDVVSFLLNRSQEEDEETYIEFINYINFHYQMKYKQLSSHRFIQQNPHSTIRNFENIVIRENYIKPEIGECIELPTQECIVIIKTFWLKIIQRVWKNIFKERQKFLLNPSFLFQCQIGKSYINNLPSIHGMLSFLRNNKNNKIIK